MTRNLADTGRGILSCKIRLGLPYQYLILEYVLSRSIDLVYYIQLQRRGYSNS